MPKPAKHALAVLASPELVVAKENFKSLESAAVAQCAAVGELESKAAAGAILAGLTLHRVKASLPYGKFGPWLGKNLTKVKNWTKGTANTNASYYMRLSLLFVEKTRADKAALLALPSDGAALDLGAGAGAKKLAAALEKFVGEHSLTELLIKHGIKGVGLKSDLAADTAADASGDSQTSAQLGEQMWLELWQSAQLVRETLIDPNKVQHLTDAKKVETLIGEFQEAERALKARLETLRAKKP